MGNSLSSSDAVDDAEQTSALLQQHPYPSPHNVLLSPSEGNYDDESGSEDALFTGENAPTLAAFFLFVFSSGTFMSVLTPFLPLELAKCGCGSVLVGAIFAAYPLANFVAVPLSTRLCKTLGRSKAFITGSMIEALFGIFFGYAHLFVPLAAQKWTYLGIRFTQGLGSSIAYTALMAWVTDRFRSRLASVLGFQEAVGGVGYMMGPPIGGFLHGIAGMALPLLVCSLLVLASIPSLFWSILVMKEPAVSDDDDEEEEDTRSNNNSVSENDLTVASLVNVSTVNSSFVTFVAAIGFGFISPVAAPHFRHVLSEDISAGSIGLLLAIPAFLYAIFSPLSGILAESYGCKQTMFFGMVLLLVTYLLFGPFPYLTELFGLASYTKGMWTDQVLSLVLLGIGAAFAFVPSLPDMQKSVEEMGPEATNAIAGYFNGVYCLGEAAGPILAGLKQFMPFPYVCTVIAAVHAGYVLVACYWKMTTTMCQTAIRRASSKQSDLDNLESPLLYNANDDTPS